ncbi:MAG TPA: hypothetical protein VGQ00_04620 [Candidatus Norongarragalinales archaeon]|jgi:hypothetical protein|nr:hypothetical protein [Candidatus Norongarragalinales archaeon]
MASELLSQTRRHYKIALRKIDDLIENIKGRAIHPEEDGPLMKDALEELRKAAGSHVMLSKMHTDSETKLGHELEALRVIDDQIEKKPEMEPTLSKYRSQITESISDIFEDFKRAYGEDEASDHLAGRKVQEELTNIAAQTMTRLDRLVEARAARALTIAQRDKTDAKTYWNNTRELWNEANEILNGKPGSEGIKHALIPRPPLDKLELTPNKEIVESPEQVLEKVAMPKPEPTSGTQTYRLPGGMTGNANDVKNAYALAARILSQGEIKHGLQELEDAITAHAPVKDFALNKDNTAKGVWKAVFPPLNVGERAGDPEKYSRQILEQIIIAQAALGKHLGEEHRTIRELLRERKSDEAFKRLEKYYSTMEHAHNLLKTAINELAIPVIESHGKDESGNLREPLPNISRGMPRAFIDKYEDSKVTLESMGKQFPKRPKLD